MQVNKVTYNEIAKANISENRNVIISECNKGGYTIAQQLEVNEAGNTISVFMKGALHIDSLKGLYNLRDAINYAILLKEQKSENEMPEAWNK